MRTRLLFVALIFTVPCRVNAAEPEPTPQQIKTAVTKSIPLLQKSADGYTKQRECFSCHHQAMTLFALTTAKAHGFDVSQETLDNQVAHTLKHLETNRDNYKKG